MQQWNTVNTNVGGGASHTINVAFDGVNTKFKATHTNGQKAKLQGRYKYYINQWCYTTTYDTATPSTGFGFDLDGTIVFSQAPLRVTNTSPRINKQ